jgi:hypothetical protein
LAARAGWRLGGRPNTSKRDAIRLSYALSPLGLAAWLAFTMSFAFGSLAYVWPVLSDPLGLAWNLVGTADRAWQPYLAAATPLLQIAVMIGGLLWTALEVRRTTTTRQALPVLAYSTLFTLGMLWLLI